MAKKKVTSYDGHFLELLRAGNKGAIKQACSIAMHNFSNTGDEVMTYIHDALKQISNGERPDMAFQYVRSGKKGRAKDNNGYRDWVIALEVQRIRDIGYNEDDARAVVAGVTKPALGVDDLYIKKIRGWQAKKLKELKEATSVLADGTAILPGMPDDIFPIPEGVQEIMASLFPVPDTPPKKCAK